MGLKYAFDGWKLTGHFASRITDVTSLITAKPFAKLAAAFKSFTAPALQPVAIAA